MLQLPKTFIESISCCVGFDEEAFINAHQINSPTSIRLNPFKPSDMNFPLTEKVLWNDKGFYLKERPNFTYDVLFQAGCYYVQEAGSMFIEHALKSCVDFTQDISAFDVCASPGGKSTLLNSLITDESLLVSNEVVKPRADVLAQNLTKWGTNNVVVTNNDPSAFSEMHDVFDVILVDAPCSGSGLFRKQHDAIDEWSLDNVNLCSQRQKRILSDIIPTLKDNGVLVYSTCSYSEAENEEIVDWIINEFQLESIKISIQTNWGIVETSSKQHKGFGYRFYPDKTQTEGFFCAVFKKTNENNNNSNRKNKPGNFQPLKAKEKEPFKNWIENYDQQIITKFKDDYLLINQAVLNFINKYTHLYLKKAGTIVGSIIKNDIIPHHDLALSIHLYKNVNKINCSEEEATKYLKKELQSISGDKGWALMTYKNYGIGWIKNLGNRLNNYLPNEFRILK